MEEADWSTVEERKGVLTGVKLPGYQLFHLQTSTSPSSKSNLKQLLPLDFQTLVVAGIKRKMGGGGKTDLGHFRAFLPLLYKQKGS